MHSPASLDPPGQDPAAHPQAADLPGVGKAGVAPIRGRISPLAPLITPNASTARSRRFSFVLKEAFMFEEQPQPEIEALIKANPEFKQLYQRHQTLDKKVMDAELGVLPIDDTTLSRMKREKLAAKDRLIRMYDTQPH